MRIQIEAVKLDSTTVKVHPGRHRRFKKNGPQAIGKSRGGWTTKIHLVAANARTAITFALSRPSLRCRRRPRTAGRHRTVARAAAPAHGPGLRGQRNPATGAGFRLYSGRSAPTNRLDPWQYDRAMYRKRNEIERLFRRLKGFRRIFSRFENWMSSSSPSSTSL